jgi:hypothetical protein
MQINFTAKGLSRFGSDKQLIYFNVPKESYILFGAKIPAFKKYGLGGIRIQSSPLNIKSLKT